MYNLTFKKQTKIDSWFITSNLKVKDGLVFVSMVNPLGDNDKSKLINADELFEVFNVSKNGAKIDKLPI